MASTAAFGLAEVRGPPRVGTRPPPPVFKAELNNEKWCVESRNAGVDCKDGLGPTKGAGNGGSGRLY